MPSKCASTPRTRRPSRPRPARSPSTTRPAASACASIAPSTEGYSIPPYYDSLIGKLIVYGRTRNECLQRLRRAVDEFVVDGVKTTLPPVPAPDPEPGHRRAPSTTSTGWKSSSRTTRPDGCAASGRADRPRELVTSFLAADMADALASDAPGRQRAVIADQAPPSQCLGASTGLTARSSRPRSLRRRPESGTEGMGLREMGHPARSLRWKLLGPRSSLAKAWFHHSDCTS